MYDVSKPADPCASDGANFLLKIMWNREPLSAQFYFDVLLTELQAADVGCFIDNRFAASLAYDDIILLTPSARAMRHMLSTCDNFRDK
jgi:hypothetical protein